MTHQHLPEGTQAKADAQKPSDQPAATVKSPTDELAAGMIRTLEEIQRDPLLHHRLSQRGF
jgi:hypothetical protein